MEYSESRDNQRRGLNINAFISDEAVAGMGERIKAHLTQQLINTLYAELLPVMREKVGAALNAHVLARAIEGEVQMAIHAALGGM